VFVINDVVKNGLMAELLTTLWIADRAVTEKPTVLYWSEVRRWENAAAQTWRWIQVLLTQV